MLSAPLCSTHHLLEGLAVVDDGNHVLHVTVWVLPVSQVFFFVKLGFIFVSEITLGNPKLSPVTGRHHVCQETLITTFGPEESLNINILLDGLY